MLFPSGYAFLCTLLYGAAASTYYVPPFIYISYYNIDTEKYHKSVILILLESNIMICQEVHLFSESFTPTKQAISNYK